MTYEAYLNGEYAGPAATVKGWGNFGRWVDCLPSDTTPGLQELVRQGRTSNGHLLAGELRQGMQQFPPREAVRSTAEGILGYVEGLAGGNGTLEISDGTADDKDADDDDSESRSARPPTTTLSRESVELKKFNGYSYASSQVNLPANIAEKVEQFASDHIPADALSPENATQDVPHITVKYGILDDSPASSEAALRFTGPIHATLGKMKVFRNNPEWDVLVIAVDSPDLHNANSTVKAVVSCVDTFPTYDPHVTVAYVKKGEGEAWEGDPTFDGIQLTFRSIIFSSREGNEYEIPLNGYDFYSPYNNYDEDVTYSPEAKAKPEGGYWVTIDGTHVFIKDGESVQQAISELHHHGGGLLSDKEGNPVTFYHGTDRPLERFDLSKLRTGADKGGSSWYGDGVYLTGEPLKAKGYSYLSADTGHVISTHVSVKKPFVVEGTSAGAWSKALHNEGIETGLHSSEVTKQLKAKGYDSVAVIKDDGKTINELVVFDADKVHVNKAEHRDQFDYVSRPAASADSVRKHHETKSREDEPRDDQYTTTTTVSGAPLPEDGATKSTSPDSDVPDFTDPNVQKSTASESYAQASAPLKELLAADVVD